MSETAAAGAIATITATADKAGRIDQVFAWLIAGHSEADIIAAVEKFWPGTKPRPLLINAWKRIARSGANADHDSARGFVIEATRETYRRAMEAGDYSAALRAIKMIAEFSQEN